MVTLTFRDDRTGYTFMERVPAGTAKYRVTWHGWHGATLTAIDLRG